MDLLTGREEFIFNDAGTGIIVQDFWRWAYSDLLNNTYRGVMTEFLVYSALSRTSSRPLSEEQIRINWLPYDLTSPSGIRIEVKSAAYLQSWTEDLFSQIRFDIAPKLASTEDGYAAKKKRNCDLYVFCLYTALSRSASILNLDYWEFYLLPTCVLNEKVPLQQKISLSSLQKLNPLKTDFAGLGSAIESINLKGR